MRTHLHNIVGNNDSPGYFSDKMIKMRMFSMQHARKVFKHFQRLHENDHSTVTCRKATFTCGMATFARHAHAMHYLVNIEIRFILKI